MARLTYGYRNGKTYRHPVYYLPRDHPRFVAVRLSNLFRTHRDCWPRTPWTSDDFRFLDNRVALCQQLLARLPSQTQRPRRSRRLQQLPALALIPSLIAELPEEEQWV